jgi:excisionase family DNA binding protein
VKTKLLSKIIVFTPAQVAEVLNTSPRWVYKHLANNTIPCTRIGRKIFISEDTLAKFLAGTSASRGGRTKCAGKNKAAPVALQKEVINGERSR